MKKLLVIILISVGMSLPQLALAESKYNPWTNQWENRSSDDVIKYNPWQNSWDFEDKDSTLEYNPWTNKWGYTQ